MLCIQEEGDAILEGGAIIHEPRPAEKGPLLSVEKCGEFGLVDCKEQDGF